MNFLIFRDFSGIFLNLFKYILDFKYIKIIIIKKRGLLIAQDPRGCDVARKTTWQSHADPRECLRGSEVTRVCIYIYS